MPVDNAIYDTEPWRDERGIFAALAALTPPRFTYMRDVLVGKLGYALAGLRVLDVGCGGGFLAEAFARAGCRVTGIDPSAPTIRQAEEHASAVGLGIDYRMASGEALPFDDHSFGIVYCCDVLEHVRDLDRAIAESARVLAPGGVYLFDTINRTLASKMVVIKLVQEWQSTRLVTTNLHDWNMFIRPKELRHTLGRHGLQTREMVGLNPTGNPLGALHGLRQVKRGTLSFAELAAKIAIRPGVHMPILYAGYAIKRTGTA
jgi:2-polyprenyl-6-hydroxyphenyl methylase / 3-demethylubiquinone-9 3-methyltransferase